MSGSHSSPRRLSFDAAHLLSSLAWKLPNPRHVARVAPRYPAARNPTKEEQRGERRALSIPPVKVMLTTGGRSGTMAIRKEPAKTNQAPRSVGGSTQRPNPGSSVPKRSRRSPKARKTGATKQSRRAPFSRIQAAIVPKDTKVAISHTQRSEHHARKVMNAWHGGAPKGVCFLTPEETVRACLSSAHPKSASHRRLRRNI